MLPRYPFRSSARMVTRSRLNLALHPTESLMRMKPSRSTSHSATSVRRTPPILSPHCSRPMASPRRAARRLTARSPLVVTQSHRRFRSQRASPAARILSHDSHSPMGRQTSAKSHSQSRSASLRRCSLKTLIHSPHLPCPPAGRLPLLVDNPRGRLRPPRATPRPTPRSRPHRARQVQINSSRQRS